MLVADVWDVLYKSHDCLRNDLSEEYELNG